MLAPRFCLFGDLNWVNLEKLARRSYKADNLVEGCEILDRHEVHRTQFVFFFLDCEAKALCLKMKSLHLLEPDSCEKSIRSVQNNQ
jgi:hypothetical protein